MKKCKKVKGKNNFVVGKLPKDCSFCTINRTFKMTKLKQGA